jgi:hypothetical protein
VTLDELIRLVAALSGGSVPSECTGPTGRVSLDLVVRAVSNALEGCLESANHTQPSVLVTQSFLHSPTRFPFHFV